LATKEVVHIVKVEEVGHSTVDPLGFIELVVWNIKEVEVIMLFDIFNWLFRIITLWWPWTVITHINLQHLRLWVLNRPPNIIKVTDRVFGREHVVVDQQLTHALKWVILEVLDCHKEVSVEVLLYEYCLVMDQWLCLLACALGIHRLYLKFIQGLMQVVKGLGKTESDVDHAVLAEVDDVLSEMVDDDRLNEVLVWLLLNLAEVTEDALDHADKSLSIVVFVAVFE
jgi:hypothetical protein